MTQSIASSLFADGNLRLRAWFNDGTNGSQRFSPDHVLTSAPYAFTVADSAVGAAELVSNEASLDKVTGGAMIALSNGNVGVGTAAPGARLDINGSMRTGEWGHTDFQPVGQRPVCRGDRHDELESPVGGRPVRRGPNLYPHFVSILETGMIRLAAGSPMERTI